MPVDKPQRILPWWRLDAKRLLRLFYSIRIDILITAVRNGELDEQLAQTKKPAAVLKYLKTA